MARYLLSSAGRRGRLVQLLQQQLIGSSQRNFVLATDVSLYSAAGHLSDAFELVPRVLDPQFIEETLKFGKKHNCEIVIPTIDPEIEVFSKNRDLFNSSGIDLWISSVETTQLGFDKLLFHNWLIDNGFPSIPSWGIQQTGQITHRRKIVAKPRSGSSSIGVIIEENIEYLETSKLSSDYMIQEFINGFEITVDFAVSRSGEVLGVIPRRRLEIRAGEVSKGVTIYDPRIEELVVSIAKQLPGAYGVLNIQLLFDTQQDKYFVLELNPRFGGGYPLSHEAGGNLIEAMHTGIPKKFGEDWDAGIVMLRYDSEVCYKDDSFRVSPWK